MRIAVLSGFSGENSDISDGIYKSFIFGLDSQFHPNKTPKSISVEKYDDISTPHVSSGLYEKIDNDQVDIVIGPSDSACANLLISQNSQRRIPTILSFATDTNQGLRNGNSFFRTAVPGSIRSRILIEHINERHITSRVNVIRLSGAPNSYSQVLSKKISKELQRFGISPIVWDFHCGKQGMVFRELSKDPIVVCSPSFEGRQLLAELRRCGFENSFYGFGSNSNWLFDECLGLTVVSDLDRKDLNPLIAPVMRKFFQKKVSHSDPSISTMIAGSIVGQIFQRLPQNYSEMSNTSRRDHIFRELKSANFSGFFGKVNFSDDGELIGYNGIHLQIVRKNKGIIGFQPISNVYKNELSKKAILLKMENIFPFLAKFMLLVGFFKLIYELVRKYIY